MSDMISKYLFILLNSKYLALILRVEPYVHHRAEAAGEQEREPTSMDEFEHVGGEETIPDGAGTVRRTYNHILADAAHPQIKRQSNVVISMVMVMDRP